MEEFVGPDVEVVLSLKEVTDLDFINGPVFAIAKLFENQLETDVLEADSIVRFNTDLIWLTNKNNIKKMRNSNIPIKLNLCKYISETQNEKFGYVILNLRTAQFVPRGKFVRIREDHVKVLGLGKEAKGCSPQILLSLRIQDKPPDDIVQSKNNPADQKPDSPVDNKIESTLEGISVKELSTPEHLPLANKIGDCGELANVPLPSHFPPPHSARSPRTKHSLTCNITEERQNLISCETKNSPPDLQQEKRYVEAYHNYKLRIRLENILWYYVPQKFRFRFHQSRAEICSTTYPEISIEKKNEVVQLCDIRATFSLVETPTEFYRLLNSLPPMVSLYSIVQGTPTNIARGVLKTDKLTTTGDEIKYQIELSNVINHETTGNLTYFASLIDCGPQEMKDVTLNLKPEMNEGDLPPAIFGTVTDKIVDELEDWKERQKQLFQQEFTKKLQKEISEMRTEWMQRRKELEEKLSQRVEQCRELGNSLISATEDVKQKNREFVEKEKKLEITKSEIELRYLKLLTDKNDETEKIKKEYFTSLNEKEIRIAKLETEKEVLENQVKVLQKENEELKKTLKANENEMEKNKRGCLSQEQTATLLQDLKAMQEKMETANNSKLFFKEQWGRAVREIHRIKSEYSKNIQAQLQNRKEELKKLGLEQLFLMEKNKNNLERDDMLEAKDFLGSDFDARNIMSDMDFPYKSKSNYEIFKTNMDIVKASNTYLLKFNQESEERLKKLIEERDKLFFEHNYQMDDKRIIELNKEIRHLLDH